MYVGSVRCDAMLFEQLAQPAAPGSMSIQGTTGSRGYGANGIFEPTEELYNDLPCYKKRVIYLYCMHVMF